MAHQTTMTTSAPSVAPQRAISTTPTQAHRAGHAKQRKHMVLGCKNCVKPMHAQGATHVLRPRKHMVLVDIGDMCDVAISAFRYV